VVIAKMDLLGIPTRILIYISFSRKQINIYSVFENNNMLIAKINYKNL